jgi:hypothetical protein
MEKYISVEKEYKEKINEIWNNNDFSEIDIIKRGYVIHDKILENSILFIGINPSYIKTSQPGRNFINLDQEGRKSENEKPYSYFLKFAKITEKINSTSENRKVKWSHLDLLFYRETNQKGLYTIEKQKNGDNFIQKQLNITKEVIIKSKPKIIVVSNAKSRDLLKNEKYKLGFKFKFNELLGTEIVSHTSLPSEIPVFFTSMLSGQRALDNGSYERLIWHINFVLNKIEKKPVGNTV